MAYLLKAKALWYKRKGKELNIGDFTPNYSDVLRTFSAANTTSIQDVGTLWSKRNPNEQKVVKLTPRYAAVLRDKRPDLVAIVQPSSLWPHLRKYEVLDEAVEQRIQVTTLHCK